MPVRPTAKAGKKVTKFKANILYSTIGGDRNVFLNKTEDVQNYWGKCKNVE